MAYATQSGSPLEVAWSGMKWQNQNPPQMLVLCVYMQKCLYVYDLYLYVYVYMYMYMCMYMYM